ASTVIFPSVAALRSQEWKDKSGYTYGLHGTPTTFTLEERLCALEGGALVTADIAVSYNRDVLAFPGRATDMYSAGCNRLIRLNKAALITSASDLEYVLGWLPEKKDTPRQQVLFAEPTGIEKIILDMLRTRGPMLVDELALAADIPVNKLAEILLNLELSGRVECLPGKVYQLG
ncbi:MAG TPA: DNA-processing protein DprA, partial [Bacteroidales bacterium]|nr:DNA-processing protein DprA [Bacteroidales bacterium]